MSVCPCGSAQLPLYVFKLNLIFVTFLKIFREKPTLVTIMQNCEALYMLSMFCCHWWHKIILSWIVMVSGCQDIHGGINITQMLYDVTSYLQSLSCCFLKYSSPWVGDFQDLATAVQCPLSHSSTIDYICLGMDWLRGWRYMWATQTLVN
jgi:hypothetical protein